MSAITEGAEFTGESGKTYLAVGPLGQDNVWTAVDKADSTIVVLKSPSPDDRSRSWPLFQHEMIMHQLLINCSAIRKQVDRIPPQSSGSPPILVLEITDTTLWQARTKRPFSKDEVYSVARSILQGLKEVHDHGLVYVDLKMQNVMLSGFDTSSSGDGKTLVTKLGDLGIVMEPANGKAQPVAYRAPEVFFKGELTQAADIWSFGLVYSHLLEARRHFQNTGLYDDLDNGGGSMGEREQAMRYAIGNDYDLRNVEYYKGCALPHRGEDHETGSQWDELRKRGLNDHEIEFLQWVLEPDPRKRPTAQAIIDSQWFDGGEHGFTNPNGSALDAMNNAVSQGKTTLTPEPVANEPETAKPVQNIAQPTSITLPDSKASTLKDLQVENVFTPTGSGAFDALLLKRKAGSPIKEHPLVKSAMSQTGDPTTQDSGTHGQAVPGATAPQQQPAAAGAVECETVSEALPSTTPATTKATAPERPKYLGHNSSTGGTYLAYR
ncbi:hypothetical protein LTR08_000501 [Meristemomyces frigidus]|nr:hypothetical protein LTR08_000501 [Meristemomyces frigidus]